MAVTWRRIGAFALGLFVIVQIIMLILSLISIYTLDFLLNFLFMVTEAGITLSIWGWLFLILGFIFLILAIGTAYFRFSISYVPAFFSAIFLGLIFSLTQYLAFFIALI